MSGAYTETRKSPREAGLIVKRTSGEPPSPEAAVPGYAASTADAGALVWRIQVDAIR